MSEIPRNNADSPEKRGEELEKIEAKLSREEIIALGNEICERGEVFEFTGIEPVAYQKMKTTDEAYPGFSTNTDEIIKLLTAQGMKLVPQAKHNGQFFILPAESNSMDDCISPEGLVIGDAMPEDLKRFISSLK